MISPEFMLRLTANMPMKQIDIGGRPYMQRYFAGTTSDDHDVWFHRFLSSDGDRHLHNHPFNARALTLLGGYIEEMPDGQHERKADRDTVDYSERLLDNLLSFGLSPLLAKSRRITVFDWHRIVSVQPETWTLFVVAPGRLPVWFFRDEAGGLQQNVASSRDWWKSFGVRPDSGMAGVGGE